MTSSRPSPIVPAHKVKLESRKLMVCDSSRPQPEVIVNREQRLIRSIEIRCPCGQHVILDCDYGPETTTE